VQAERAAGLPTGRRSQEIHTASATDGDAVASGGHAPCTWPSHWLTDAGPTMAPAGWVVRASLTNFLS
jgi:hypothetical protein